MNEHRETLRVPADHPSLAGHFPGNPLAPGVVILDLAQSAARTRWSLPSLSAVPGIKFLAPLKPEQDFLLTLTRRGNVVSFRIESPQQLLAQGSMQFSPDAGI